MVGGARDQILVLNMKQLICLTIAALWVMGCGTVVHHGGQPHLHSGDVKIFLPQFANATDDDFAGRALTEITASSLLEKGIPVFQTEKALQASRADEAAGSEGIYAEAARLVGATHLLLGTVHEYRYKTDLDGDPAVGISMRLVDATTGETLWQGSSAKVGVLFSSLTKVSQTAARELVRRIPIHASH